MGAITDGLFQLVVPEWVQGVIIGAILVMAGALTLDKFFGPLKLIPLGFMIAGILFVLGFLTLEGFNF